MKVANAKLDEWKESQCQGKQKVALGLPQHQRR